MSHNGVFNTSPNMESAKGLMGTELKSSHQFPFNGQGPSLNSSRGSSPSPHISSIPASQLPPQRSRPSAQPPSSATLTSVTQKVSQFSIQNQLLSNTSVPQFTSTPTEIRDSSKVSVGLGAFSPISSKTDNDPTLVSENFQDIPLNQKRTANFMKSVHSATNINSRLDQEPFVPLKYDNSGNQTVEGQPTSAEFSLNTNQPDGITPMNQNVFQSHTNKIISGTILSKPATDQFSSKQSQGHFMNQQSTSHSMANQHVKNTQNITVSSVGPPGVKDKLTNSYSPLDMFQNTSGNINTRHLPNTQANLVPISHQLNSSIPNDRPPASSNFPPEILRKNISEKNPNQMDQVSSLKSMGNRMPIVPSQFQSNQPILNQMSQIPMNQNAPPNQRNSPAHSTIHSNRYPTLAAQKTSYSNIQSVNNQQSEFQLNQNKPFNSVPTNVTGLNNQSNFQFIQRPQNVVNQGFNKLWGSETHDLLQTINILPPNKIDPPRITLGNDTLTMANCSNGIFRSTITKIPESQSLLQKSRLPLGILIHPFKDLAQLSVIQCNVIVRCRACRTYINPFVFFIDSKRWKCNLCYRINDLPEEFQYDPVSKTYGDPFRRPEIKSSTIEYIAPAEYMLRPPQPAVYLFLLDISRFAIESGYLNIFCSVLQEELLNLPGDSRTQVGFIAYDSALHFFSFAEGLTQPHEMLVLDVDDVFLPCPDNLLVNLKDQIELIRDLLNQLPSRFNNNYDNNSALGAALQAAHRMMSATGGRVTVFQASLPNIGPGTLTPREDPNQRASAEVHNLKPANDFYKRLALDCSSQQIAVDLFIVNSQFVDIATISGISRFSGGCIYHIPLFKLGKPLVTDQLEKSFRRYLTRKIGFEAVMRIRCTRGMSIHTFHGNFFVRSTDLLSLPNINPDAGFGMQVSIDENLSDVEYVCFQAALLYTSSKGERRIRVHTLCLPVVSTLHDVINSADEQCIVGLLAKMAVDRSTESSLSDAREAFINVAIDILSSYKLSLNLGSIPNGLLAPNCLKLLPLYISALLKNQAFRTGTSTRLDDRVKAMIDMKNKPLPWLIQQIYPDLYPVHNLMEQRVVMSVEEEPIHIPPLLQLTSRLIDNNGAYLLDMGDNMVLYVCSGVSHIFLNEGLGISNFNMLNDQISEFPVLQNQTNQRLISFINYLNEDKPYRATLQIIKDNSTNRNVFLERLIEDRVENALSYHEFLQHIKSQVK